MAFRDVGWVWEGLAFDPGVQPTIYGLGEGMTYFGVERAHFMFHPNNEITLAKLSHAREIVCDITKMKWAEMRDAETGRFGFRHWGDHGIETQIEEAEKLSRLSLQFPNVTAGYIDDPDRMVNYQSEHPTYYADISAALRSANPALQWWALVFSHQLGEDHWQPFLPYMDVANLWVWEWENIPHLEEYVELCHKTLPGKAIVVGSFIRDYDKRAPVPLEMMQMQYETMFELWEEERIAGYSILGAALIDQHPQQAEFIRSFIGGH